MKKIHHMILAAAVLSLAAACTGNKVDPTPTVPAVIKATFTSLEKVGVNPGTVVELPVKGTAEDGVEMSLSFFSDRIYLPSGTYSVGTNAGNYQGHIKSSKAEGNIVGGMLTVTIEGEEDYAISGTVRLDNPDKTMVKIRAKGVLSYDFPAEYYYTVSKNQTVCGIKADVYRIFEMNDNPYQVAEFALVGAESGTFTISASGEAGTAVYGSAAEGTWVYEEGIGWHNIQHGTVTVSDVRGKKTFVLDDTYSATFANCEMKSSLNGKPRSGDDSWTPGNSWIATSLTSKLFVTESPVARGMYEVTARVYFPDGREFMSCTFLSPEESTYNKGRQTNTLAGYNDYADVSVFTPMGPTCYYVIDGVRYGPGDTKYIQMYDRVNGDIRAIGIYLFLDEKQNVPEPLSSFLGAAVSKAFGFMPATE